MDARYTFRKSQLLDECQVAPEIFEQVIPRLYSFMKPFVNVFHGKAAAQHAKIYVCGLLSDVKHKNIESIAYRFGQSRLPLQGFILAVPSNTSMRVSRVGCYRVLSHTVRPLSLNVRRATRVLSGIVSPPPALLSRPRA